MATAQQNTWNNSGAAPMHWRRPKLTPAQRLEIHQRVAAGESIRDLATEYGVSARTIRHYAA